MLVLHANWSGRTLWIWGETAAGLLAPLAAAVGAETAAEGAAETPEGGAPASGGGAGEHPFAIPAADLRIAMSRHNLPDPGDEYATLKLALPTRGRAPAPSPRLAHAVGMGAGDEEAAEPMTIGRWDTPAVGFDARSAMSVLERLEDVARRRAGVESDFDSIEGEERRVTIGPSIAFFAAAARFARMLVAEQRVVPMVLQHTAGELEGSWSPWLNDERVAGQVGQLLEAMPPAARAVADDLGHDGWPILEDFLRRTVDAICREALIAEEMIEAIEDRSPEEDDHVAWLSGLLGADSRIPVAGARRSTIYRDVREWIRTLDDRGEDVQWRLCLRLNEPAMLPGDEQDVFEAPGKDVLWAVTFHLESVEGDGVMMDAVDIWSLGADATTVNGRRLNDPKHLLLAELARAARLYKRLEDVLSEDEPTLLELNTNQAYEFLREIRPLLQEQGFGVEAPDWWESPSARVGARLLVDSPDANGADDSSESGVSNAAASFGLDTLVDYQWRIAVGDRMLTLADFERLAGQESPLIRVKGQWIELRPEDISAAVDFIRENPGGKIRVSEALRIAYGSDTETTGVPVLGMEASGWVATIFGDGMADHGLPEATPPVGFQGALRPYQLKGVAWLSFLDSFGFGACLADDMGLGKTIQLLALLQREREDAESHNDLGSLKPTLVVAPMSVVGNWRREATRFVPTLKSMIHHGVDRYSGDELVRKSLECDLVITTYALAHRDFDDLARVGWGRLVLDEAQKIKNPSAKQTQALRAMDAPRRICLTGTPVENRLSELWSIMEFCNPGYLGGPTEFRRKFSVPIERRHDRRRSEQLRSLVRPFVLRRLKTDPKVTADLPDKVESKEFCHLTAEQARLYEEAVKKMLSEVDRAEGMQRRGVVLATLIKLKQICNHPLQALKDEAAKGPDQTPDPARSGKTIRILEMLDEVIAAEDNALVFTQFRQMGKLLTAMISHRLDRDVLFLHGGTPQKVREQMVDRFQKADGSAPIFVLSLRAGGLGMNLTAASHVFHFDRWWNPAVENQATDRAHRIGQTRTVQVHKFIVSGTLEERIDEMIEQKTELADRIITSGEQWLTELSTNQLKDLLTLRADAVGDA